MRRFGRDRCEAGFSMIEVLFVMIIIGILAAIAIPMYVGQRDRAKDAAVRVGGRQIATALLSAVLDSDAGDPWPSQCDPVSLSRYLGESQWPANPFEDGARMHTVTERSPGDYLYVRETTGPQPRPYHLVVFLKKQADFIVP